MAQAEQPQPCRRPHHHLPRQPRQAQHLSRHLTAAANTTIETGIGIADGIGIGIGEGTDLARVRRGTGIATTAAAATIGTVMVVGIEIVRGIGRKGTDAPCRHRRRRCRRCPTSLRWEACIEAACPA
jgi:hypothetical protein